MITMLTMLATATCAVLPTPTVLTEPGEIPRLRTVQGGHELPLQHTDVFIRASGLAARVEVRQRYHNTRAETLEVEYVFPLPENAAVDGMRFEVDDRVIEGRIERRAEARAQYQAARDAGQRAALLEQERPNVFRQRLANIAPDEHIDVVITYVQELSYADGWTEVVFPMVVGERFFPPGPRSEAERQLNPPVFGPGVRDGHDISIDVVVEPAGPLFDVDVPTHEVELLEEDGVLTVTLADRAVLPNRDFVLRWETGSEEGSVSALAHRPDPAAPGWLSVVLQPPVLPAGEAPALRELIFVVDVSGSMDGLPLATARAFMEDALRGLRPQDTFDVLTFAGASRRLFGEPRPASRDNIRQALEIVAGWSAGGGTMMADAVGAALHPDIGPERERTVVFLTDGQVGNEDQIIAAARRFVARNPARVIAVGTGAGVNGHLIEGLGSAGRGFSYRLPTLDEAGEAVERLYRTLDAPVVEEIELTLEGGVLVDTPEIPDLFSTQPRVVQLRYDGFGPATLVLRGHAAGLQIERRVRLNLPEAADRPEIASLWAQSRIRAHQRRIWALGEDEASSDVERATELALEHALVTPWTSFVAIDEAGGRVGPGTPTLVRQAVHPMAGLGNSAGFVAGHGSGGMGLTGTGTGGGGGMGIGRIGGLGAKHVQFKESPKRLVVTLGRVTLTGKLSQAFTDQIKRLLRRWAASTFRSCLKVAERRGESVEHAFKVQFRLDRKARVSKVVVGTPGGLSAGTQQCLQRSVERLQLPTPPSTVSVRTVVLARRR